MILPRYDGTCPMRLADGRCGLQVEAGEDTLPAVCRQYPRSIRPGECCCSNSCEAVIELLDREAPIRFQTISREEKAFPRKRVHFFETGGREIEIRLWLIAFLQDRSIPLGRRLARLGEAVRHLDEALTAHDFNVLDDLLSGKTGMLKLSGLNDILECYHENIWADKNCWYFFDEIQYASDWDKWLKSIYDMQPQTQMVATGSASPALIKGSTESGAGRWSVIQVPTLSFYEYCALTNVAVPELGPEIRPTAFRRMSQRERAAVMLKLEPLQNHFMRYLRVGGFPELALASNDLMAQQIMREDVVDKVLKRDLPALYNIRSATELERIFLYLCNVSSEIVSIAAVAKELDGVSRPTVENYIRYLESANLIYMSYPVELGGQKVLKVQPKIYIADAAIRNAVLMDEELMINPVELGKLVETAVYKHIAAFYYQQATRVGYYRGGKRNQEIDIVVDYPNISNILIEVKYREEAPIPDDSAICRLCGEASAAIVVTKRANDFGIHDAPEGRQLIRIPAFAFLYLLGNAERYGYKGKE